MKKFLILSCLITVALSMSACGESYICNKCDKTTSKAYYDMDSNKNYVMCEDCARKYWMPLDYKTYRVK